VSFASLRIEELEMRAAVDAARIADLERQLREAIAAQRIESLTLANNAYIELASSVWRTLQDVRRETGAQPETMPFMCPPPVESR
jgi:hypothetical protein